MREWFCLNALRKVESSHEKKNSDEKKSRSLNIEVYEVLLC